MSTPTNLTISYLVYSNANPAVLTTASVVVPISSFGDSYSTAVSNIVKGGGFWNALVFIPAAQIVSITAS